MSLTQYDKMEKENTNLHEYFILYNNDIYVCRADGKNQYVQEIIDFINKHELYDIIPDF